MHELSNDPNAKPVLEFLGNGPAAGRSFAAPPGVPADRVAALRSSFMAMVKDPKFLAAAKKRFASARATAAAQGGGGGLQGI